MAQGIITVSEYLAKAANARVIYKHLFEAAVSVLSPMLSDGDDVECHYTVSDLASVIPQTKSQIANELRLLKNWGWLRQRRASVHFFGRRDERGRFLLLSDLSAFSVTGEQRIVSRHVLDIQFEDTPEPTIENTQRGATREWRGTETQGGGELDLDS